MRFSMKRKKVSRRPTKRTVKKAARSMTVQKKGTKKKAGSKRVKRLPSSLKELDSSYARMIRELSRT